jgi:hypothetical protein
MKRFGTITSLVLVAFLALSVIPANAQTSTGTTTVTVPAVGSDAPVAAPASGTTTIPYNLHASLAPKPAAASSSDSSPRFELFAGYSFLSNNIAFADDEDGPAQLVHGYAASVTFNVNRNFGILADFSGANGSMNTTFFGDKTHQTEDQYYFMFGPSLKHSFGKVRISGHVLVGLAKQHYGENFVNEEDEQFGFKNTNFAAGVGGSFDWMFNDRWGWRILQADFLTSIFDGEGA